MGSSMHAGRGRSSGPAGFTLLAILVVLAALTLVVGMALQRGEDERRSAILVRHDAIAMSAAEFGLDRTRAYVGAILDNKGDLDLALDPLLNTQCVTLPKFDLDAGMADDNLPVFDGGTRVALSGEDRSFLLLPYDPDGDNDPEGAYLVRIDDNDDDANSPHFKTITGNNVGGPLECKEGLDALRSLARTNPARDRDRTVVLTVVGISPGTDVTRAQARKVLRARVGSPPSAGLIAGGTIEMQGTAHICGAYGNVSVKNGGMTGGCVCGAGCKGGPADQSCGAGNLCNVQVTSSTCTDKFGGGGGTCTTGANVPPAPKVEVWSKLNAPPACYTAPCIPFYYLRADKVDGLAGSTSDKAQVYMWNYVNCPDPQALNRIHYPGEPGVAATDWTVEKADLTANSTTGCWKLVYDGNNTPSTAACPATQVRMKDDASLDARNPPMLMPLPVPLSLSCATAPLVWEVKATNAPTTTLPSACDALDTIYPEAGTDKRYKRHYNTGAAVSYKPPSSNTVPLAPIPHGVWLVDGDLTFEESTPGFVPVNLKPPVVQLPQPPVTILATGDVTVMNGKVLSLRPAHREVSLLAGRDLDMKTGQSKVLTCGDPSSQPTNCPSAAIMVHEQFDMGSNSHLQGQLVVQNAGHCSNTLTGNPIKMGGNATVSVPGMPPIHTPGGTAVLSWSESSL